MAIFGQKKWSRVSALPRRPAAYKAAALLAELTRHPKYKNGASGGSRNLIPSLENLYTNRCTTLATFLFYHAEIFFAIN